MFENVGKIVKNSASIVLIIGIVFSFGSGFLFTETIFTYLMYVTVGVLFSWITYVVIYGFGHHIETTDKILEKLSEEDNINLGNIPLAFTTKENLSVKNISTKKISEYNNEVTTQIIDKMIEEKKNKLNLMYENDEITKAEYEELIKELENRTV